MITRRVALVVLAAVFAAPAAAQEKLKVLASFSILGDLVKNVGGDRVEVGTVVGANGNAHVYAPSPADSRRIVAARLVVVNGLGFEGWLDRLVKASDTKAPVVVASAGVKPLQRAGEAEEVVGAALYFASPAASYTTGAILTIDGGSAHLITRTTYES